MDLFWTAYEGKREPGLSAKTKSLIFQRLNPSKTGILRLFWTAVEELKMLVLNDGDVLSGLKVMPGEEGFGGHFLFARGLEFENLEGT